MSRALGEFEISLLWTVLRLGDEAYGAAVWRELESRQEKSVASGAIYTGLERLEARGMLRSRVGGATPERGGRRKRYYTLRTEGARALDASMTAIREVSRGLNAKLGAVVRDERA